MWFRLALPYLCKKTIQTVRGDVKAARYDGVSRLRVNPFGTPKRKRVIRHIVYPQLRPSTLPFLPTHSFCRWKPDKLRPSIWGCESLWEYGYGHVWYEYPLPPLLQTCGTPNGKPLGFWHSTRESFLGTFRDSKRKPVWHQKGCVSNN